MLDLNLNILEFEGRKAFVVLTYDEYIEIEEQLQELEDIRMLSHAKALDAPTVSLSEFAADFVNEMEQGRTTPLDVVGVELGISADEIVQIVAEGRRSTPPMIAKAATGQPIPALSTDELADLGLQEDLYIYQKVRTTG